ncbi:unnamed protein product [Cuscuta campestris]|uniref:Uncharacterized protein n=1 Tax=Cuscuta campestris TaxID=132261 RepID=A0A484MSF2_9ASTE|nr:unnamed protein product [Cuscuta campestris]
MRCDLQENDSQTFVRYLFGLNTQIANTVELQNFESLEDLTKLALKVEAQLKKGKSPLNPRANLASIADSLNRLHFKVDGMDGYLERLDEAVQRQGHAMNAYFQHVNYVPPPYHGTFLGEVYDDEDEEDGCYIYAWGLSEWLASGGSGFWPFVGVYVGIVRNFVYSPYQDSDGDNYYEPHGDQDDYDHSGPMCDDQSDPLVEEIIRLEQKIFYFDEVLFAEGSWYKPPYCQDYTLVAEEQIEANKVAIRERAKLLESVWKEKEFKRKLCEGSELMHKMLDDFQRERLEAKAKDDELVNDLCKAVELKRSLQSQDQMKETNVQKEALEPKTNPETSNHLAPFLEDSSRLTLSQKAESITTLVRATLVMLPESLHSQVPTSIVVHKVEPAEGTDLEPPMLTQEEKRKEVLPMAINNHILNCVENTPLEEPVLEEIEPTMIHEAIVTHQIIE